MNHELRVLETSADAASAAARFLWEQADAADAAAWALSGGTTPDAMFARLAGLDVPWERLDVFQVDERVAPDGDPARNATRLQTALGARIARFHPMDVTAVDLEAACARYATALPERLDLVHLGLGPDGHTASLVPGDPVLEVTDRAVALTGEYQGHRRMTLTFPALDAARIVVFLVAGADKREALARLLDGDTEIPGGRVNAERSVVFCDAAAR